MQNRNPKIEAAFHDLDHDARTLNLGLDVMEMLMAADAPPTPEEMAARLSSPVDIVRHVVDFIEARGYLGRAEPDALDAEIMPELMNVEELPVLTPALRELVRCARPVMRTVSDDIAQSCNLAIPAGRHLLVIAQAEPASPFYINMPVGRTYEMAHTAPGLLWSANGGAMGFTKAANACLEEVTDISCPIMGESGPVAVLTVPYLEIGGGVGLTACVCEVIQAAAAISEALAGIRLAA